MLIFKEEKLRPRGTGVPGASPSDTEGLVGQQQGPGAMPAIPPSPHIGGQFSLCFLIA